MDPDEAHYAQLTREMLRAGNWMVPLLDGLPYIDKPVLFHWLQGLAIAVLGETEAAMRLPSAIAAIALFWLTRWTGAQLFDERVGVRAWLMLATLPMTFMLGSIGVFDMVFTAFLFGAIAVAHGGGAAQPSAPAVRVVRAAEPGGHDQGPGGAGARGPVFSRGTGVRTGVPRGAAVAALEDGRGAHRGVVAAVVCVDVLSRLGGSSSISTRSPGICTTSRSRQSFSNRAVNHTLYVSTFLAGFFPWSIVTLGGAVDALRRWRAKVEAAARRSSAVGLGRASCSIFFSLARFKVDRYVYPAAPACCLLAARAWLSVERERGPISPRRATTSARGGRSSRLGSSLVAVGICRGILAVRPRARACRRAAVLMPIEPRGRRRRADRHDLQAPGRLAHAVCGRARGAARDLRQRCDARPARAGARAAHRGRSPQGLRSRLAAGDQGRASTGSRSGGSACAITSSGPSAGCSIQAT